MRIDIHTHAFHPKIAAKAIAMLNTTSPAHCVGDGTIEHLLEREAAAGVNCCVVLCAATTPAQVIPANNYAISLQRQYPGKVIAFGSLHPAFPEWEKELERLKTAGIRGIKLHPELQGFRLDDNHLLPIFETAQNNFIFQIHVGAPTTPERAPSCPYKLAAVLDAFPRLRVIAAHFGGCRMWGHALRTLASPRRKNLWFDTSSTTALATELLFDKLLRAFPRERFLFGTDWPLYDPVEEISRLQNKCHMKEKEIEEIMNNALDVIEI